MPSAVTLALPLAVALVAAISVGPYVPSYTGEPAGQFLLDHDYNQHFYTFRASANKPFRQFCDFFPFYLTEHSENTNKLLHFIGTSIVIAILYHFPKTVVSMVLAGSVGVVLCGALQGLEHGIFEGAALLVTFFISQKVLSVPIKVVRLKTLKSLPTDFFFPIHYSVALVKLTTPHRASACS